jgi:hypothetical protein
LGSGNELKSEFGRRKAEIDAKNMNGMHKISYKGLNPDKPEITNYKHQITNKFQITISKSQIRSNTNCLGF